MISILRAWLVAVWEFFSDPAIDLNTDFAPEFDAMPRDYHVWVFRGNAVVYDVQFRQTRKSKEEIELLFIDAGYSPSSIDVSEVA